MKKGPSRGPIFMSIQFGRSALLLVARRLVLATFITHLALLVFLLLLTIALARAALLIAAPVLVLIILVGHCLSPVALSMGDSNRTRSGPVRSIDCGKPFSA
jgi:fatty acid desaturase